MRTILFMALISASTLGAQQSAAPHKTLVIQQYNAAEDVFVNLLGEEPAANGKATFRVMNSHAAGCALASSAPTGNSRVALSPIPQADGSIEVPAGWATVAIPNIQVTPSGQWSKLAVMLVASQDRRAELQSQIYVTYSSDEGFPRVLLMKDSKVVSTDECQSQIGSLQAVGMITAKVVTSERGPLTYVVGYAKVANDVWIKFLGSASNPADVADLSKILRSLAVSGTK